MATTNNAADYSPTQYNTQVGGANGTLVNIAPSATSGIPLVSNGSSSNPSFTTAVVAGGGTGAVTFTSHGVLLGNTTGAITATAAGTTGQVLTGVTGSAPTFQSPAASSISITGDSGGALTGAAFTFTGGTTGLTFAGAGSTETVGGTLVVANGGTGNTTFTAYSVLCAGTTATGVFQNVSGLGSSGNVLTSNGAGALPTWQAAASGGITTINGDSGSVTGSTVSIKTNGATNGGSSTSFSGSGTAMTFNVTDANNNTIIGKGAGNGAMSSVNLVGLGYQVLKAATSAGSSVAIGFSAMTAATSGGFNVAIGGSSLSALTTGQANVCVGTTTATSYTGAESSNIILGYNNTGTLGESNVLRIGNGTGTGFGNLNQSFISGITGITVTGTAVLISAGNQLGIAVSSRKYKENIKDMAGVSSDIYKLRPVTFTLKDNEDQSTQFGLIAEEVYEVMPDLVVLDKEGDPQTVQYHELPAILLNEIQKLNKRIAALEKKCL